MNINGGELLIILLVALVVLGPKELPRVGRALGTMVREFRRASRELVDELGLGDGAGDAGRSRERGRDRSEGNGEQ